MDSPQVFQHLSAYLTPAATWVHLVLFTCLAVLVVHLLTRLVRFVVWQVKIRNVLKQFSTPPKHWLFGHNLKPNQRGFPTRLEWMKQYSSHFCPLWIGPFNVFTQCVHPETIRTILGTAEPKSMSYRFLEPWLGDGLLTSKGSKWHRNRRLLTPAFHFEILKPYVTLFSESTNVLIDKWSEVPEGSSIELFDHVSLLTLDSMLKCSLGYRSNCQTDGQSAPYIQAVFELSRLIIERIRFFPFHFDFIYNLSPSGRRFRQQCDIVHGISEHLIQQRKKALQDGEDKSEENNVGKSRKYLDFLDILLQAKDEDGTGLTDAEIRDEVDTFLFEGHDTTASGISWTLYHLAKHLQYQDRCRREVGELLHGRTEMTWEDMSKLPFTTMCIKESLRIRPPVPSVSRRLTKTLTFPDGKTMPEGSLVTAGIIYSHHNHLIWTDPEVYDPLRFSPERSKDRHHHAFVPFSAGPRNCIGQNFAMNEMKVAVALILQRFRLEIDETKPAPFFVQQLILRAKDGIWIKLTPNQ